MMSDLIHTSEPTYGKHLEEWFSPRAGDSSTPSPTRADGNVDIPHVLGEYDNKQHGPEEEKTVIIAK